MSVGTVTATVRVRTTGMWRLWLAALLGRIAARRGVDVRIEVGTR